MPSVRTHHKFVRYRQAADAGRVAISAEKPGQSGLFGTIVGSAELVNTIGLDHDTNLSHSRRILMLEESRSLLDEQRHAALLQAITARYLYDQQNRPGGVPRFLLNDVMRYWRTVAVDYQAKRWQEQHGQKWGSRLLKLRSSRKLTYAGTLVSLFMPALTETDLSPENLTAQWLMPPLARLAQLSTILGERGKDNLRTTLVLADELLRYVSDQQIRRDASDVAHLREALPGSGLAVASGKTVELGQALQQLFLEDEPIPSCREPQGLRGLTARYLLF